MLLTKSRVVKIFLKSYKINSLDVDTTMMDTNDVLLCLFENELKIYFKDLCKYKTVDDKISINFLIKCLLFILEKLNVGSLARMMENKNGKKFFFFFKNIKTDTKKIIVFFFYFFRFSSDFQFRNKIIGNL